jgi:hypothetical protein
MGGVLDTKILCITMKPIYDALLVILDPKGFLSSFADDIYMGGAPMSVLLALTTAPTLYEVLGLLLGWGPKKTELVLPPN